MIPEKARGFLDFIGNKEAPKGYGQVHSQAASFLNRDLTSMTLDEVLQWQRQVVAQGAPSSAAGRYQFVRGTLGDLKKRLGLSGSERFDQSLQDRLGYELLRRRGFEKWQGGQLSNEEFALGLAREWASLPVLSDMKGDSRAVRRGESYYAGDGLNAALTDASTLEALISGGEVPRSSLAPKVAPLPPKKPRRSVTTPSTGASSTKLTLSALLLRMLRVFWKVLASRSGKSGSAPTSSGTRDI